MTDITIIGAGTAGLTAAIYALRAGCTVTVVEENIYGGQIINTPTIENYPGLPGISGAEFAFKLYQQAENLGAKIQYGAIKSLDLAGKTKVITLENQTLASSAVIIAGGTKARKLACPGEDRLIGKGVSYCATCDGAFHRGKDVLVVGGGNTAIEDALVLADICKTVYLVHRRSEFRADAKAIARLKERENVIWKTGYTTEEILGEETMSAVRIKQIADETIETLPVSGIFIAIGSVPSTEEIPEEIDRDDSGYILADESCQTNIPGVFVAGDIRTKKVRQLVTAAADGAVAALAAKEYIQRN